MTASLDQFGYNWADWCIVVVVGLSALISVVRGFVKEALSLLVWLAAFVVAFFFAERLAPLLGNLVSLPSLRYLAAFAMLFVATLMVGSLINYLIGQLVKITGLSGIDRLLGMMFGVCRGVLIALLILIFVPKMVPVQQDPWWQQSKLIPKILVLETWARRTAASMSDWGREQLDRKNDIVEKVQQQREPHGSQ